MQMRAEFFAARDYLDDPVAQLFGIERAYPHPLDWASLGDHFEQASQLDGRIEILAVTAQMHSSKDDFLEASCVKIVERRHHATRLNAPRSASRKRHDTKCAELIAAFLQLQERARMTVERYRGQLDRRLLLAQVGDHHALASS